MGPFESNLPPGTAQGFGVRGVPRGSIQVPPLPALQTRVCTDPPPGILLRALFSSGPNEQVAQGASREEPRNPACPIPKVDDCKAEALPNCSGQDCEAAASNIADDPNRLDTSFSRSARGVARQSHCRRIGLKINGDSLERTPALAGAIVLARRRIALGDDRSHRMDEETRLTIDPDRASSTCKENRPPLPRPSQGGLSSLRVAPSIPRLDFRV